MSYEEFQQLARLFIVGTLDDEEMEQFCAGRMLFGQQAEDFINECRKLNSIFALSLRPRDPDPATKEKLFARIKNTEQLLRSEPIDSSDHTQAQLSRRLTLTASYPGRN